MKKAIFHVHTHHSFDSTSSPKHIVDKAVKHGINYLVITDHDSLQGSIDAQNYARTHKLPIEIPLAAEYYTDVGDLITVGVPADFQKISDHRKLAKKTKEVGGYVILPHPYAHHDLENMDFTHIDCIEIFNSRTAMKNNELAIELAKKVNKSVIFGSDAHFLSDLLNAVFRYEGDTPFDGQVSLINQRPTHWFHKDMSQITKAYKTHDGALALRIVKRMSKNVWNSLKIKFSFKP